MTDEKTDLSSKIFSLSEAGYFLKVTNDNIWIERFCKTIKYEYIYIQPEENGADLFFEIKRFIDNYNYHRRHQGINRTVPSKLYIRQAAWS